MCISLIYFMKFSWQLPTHTRKALGISMLMKTWYLNMKFAQWEF